MGSFGGSGSGWGAAVAEAYAAGPPAAAAAAQAVAAGSSRWTSMDGSVDGTPPGGRGLLASAATEEAADIPNPADWDPLWSDDLLGEDEGDAERPQRQAGAASPGPSSTRGADALPARTDGPRVSSSS